MASVSRRFSGRRLLCSLLTWIIIVPLAIALCVWWGNTRGLTKVDPHVDSAAAAEHFDHARWANNGNIYSPGRLVYVYATKLVRASNPSESYAYYSLPYCRQDTAVGGLWAWLDAQSGYYFSHGHTLDGGDRYQHLPVELHFGEDQPEVATCSATLTPQDAAAFRDAIDRGFRVQIALAGERTWQPIGNVDQKPSSGTAPQYSLFTDHHFDIDYDEDRIRGFRVTTDRTRFADVTDVGAGADVAFTYSATWTRVPSQPDTFRAWLRKLGAAIYSGLDAHFLLVFLVFCVSLGLSKAAYQVAWAEALARTRDVESARSTAEAEDGIRLACCESGALDPPAYSALLCAVAGTGDHLLWALNVTVVLQYANLGSSVFGQPDGASPGEVLPWLGQFVLAWVYTSGTAGCVAGTYHRLLNGKLWTRTALVTALLACGPVAAVTLALDLMAREHHTTMVLPPYQCGFLGISAAIGLVVIGLGVRAAALRPLAGVLLECGPCRLPVPVRPEAIADLQQSRPKPRLKAAPMAVCGIICALVLVNEYERVLAAVWGFDTPTSPICVLMALCSLCSLTTCMVVVLTCRQLAQPGPAVGRMWWRPPAIVAGSTSIVLFALSIYYHVTSAPFEGAYQIVRFYACTTVWCYVAGLAIASRGLRAALWCTLLATADTWQEADCVWRVLEVGSSRAADAITSWVTVLTPAAAAAEGPTLTGPGAASEAAGRDSSAQDTAAACTGVACDASSEQTALLADFEQ